MNIAHVISSLDPLGGGPPIVAFNLAAEQARQGHTVQIISYDSPAAQTRIDKMIGMLPSANRIKYSALTSPEPLERILPLNTLRAMRRFLAGVEFVHLHGVWDPLLKSAATVARKRKIPYAVQPHGMLDPWSLKQRWWKKRLALLLGFRGMLDRATFLHALNQDEADLLQPLNLTTPVIVIPNGITPEEFANLPGDGSFRAIHPELGDAPYILFLSRLHYKKGLDYLARAFIKLVPLFRQVHLVVAGPDEGAAEPFRQAIEAAHLQSRVHLIGPIFGQDRFKALTNAACFCLPSRQEGFSIAILEAMACACPVVITTNCHFPEVATAGAGEVVPLDADAITEALRRVLADPQRAQRMGNAGRELVLERYTWSAIAAKLVNAYQQKYQRVPIQTLSKKKARRRQSRSKFRWPGGH